MSEIGASGNNISVFDADGTLFEGISIFPIYELFSVEEYISEFDYEKVMNPYHQYIDRKLTYGQMAHNSLRAAAEVLRGKDYRTAHVLATEYVQRQSCYDYVAPLMKNLISANVERVLLTAEPDFIALPIADKYLGGPAFSSKFQIINDKFTGKVSNIMNSEYKSLAINKLRKNIKYAFGDSEGDIEMLDQVQNPKGAYCINPTPQLRNMAVEKGWNIIEDTSCSIVLHV